MQAEELAEKYSNELIEKDLDILEKERRISALEKAKRELEVCQNKVLHNEAWMRI